MSVHLFLTRIAADAFGRIRARLGSSDSLLLPLIPITSPFLSQSEGAAPPCSARALLVSKRDHLLRASECLVALGRFVRGCAPAVLVFFALRARDAPRCSVSSTQGPHFITDGRWASSVYRP